MPNKTKQFQELLYINYKETSEGGEICERSVGESFPDYEDEFRYTTYNYVTFNKPTPLTLWKEWKIITIREQTLYEQLKTCDKVYLAVVVYSTGDTFSHTEGMHEIIGAYPTRADAEKALEECDTNQDGYRPWEGYFERLTGKKVFKVDLEK